jgi:uncharacterized protein (DUF488 family)
MKLYTIGFTQKSAQQFFDLLKNNGIQCVVDIRLHPEGQLAGFTKKEDLRYFLKMLINCDYRHLDQLTPTDEIMKTYRSHKNPAEFEAAFLALLDERGIPGTLDRTLFEEKICCLLCSESLPDHCHRRVVAERMAKVWGDVTIVHL